MQQMLYTQGLPDKNRSIAKAKIIMRVVRDKLWGKGFISLKKFNSITDLINSF